MESFNFEPSIQLKDLTGNKFGKLVVLNYVCTLIQSDAYGLKSQYAYYKCKCDCGKDCIKRGSTLLAGRVKSCGCLRKSKRDRYIQNGEKFGKLKVLHKIENDILWRNLYKCQCLCGREDVYSAEKLDIKHIKQCSYCAKMEYLDKVKPDPQVRTKNHLYHTYKKRAKRHNLDFELAMEEFVTLTSGNCFYCGIEPKQVILYKKVRKIYPYNGIDRVDNSKGYVMGNVVSCCRTCNLAKSNLTMEDFISWGLRLYKTYLENRKNEL